MFDLQHQKIVLICSLVLNIKLNPYKVLWPQLVVQWYKTNSALSKNNFDYAIDSWTHFLLFPSKRFDFWSKIDLISFCFDDRNGVIMLIHICSHEVESWRLRLHCTCLLKFLMKLVRRKKMGNLSMFSFYRRIVRKIYFTFCMVW